MGSASGLATTPHRTLESNQAQAAFGFSVASAGDVNGDTRADVIVGAPEYNAFSMANVGAAFVYHGTGAGLATTAAWTVLGVEANGARGYSVASAGDLRADGFADVIVGAPGEDGYGSDSGRVQFYEGSASGLSTGPATMSVAGSTASLFGSVVASAGDLDGDGFSEMVVGAPHEENGALVDAGEALLWYGNSADGRRPAFPQRPVQRHPGSDDPIATAGRSLGDDGWDVVAPGFSPYGRGDVELHVEAELPGGLYDGVGTLGSGEVDLGPFGGVDVSTAVVGFGDALQYHWRARFTYDPAAAPPLLRSRWIYGGIPGLARSSHVETGCGTELDSDGDGQCDTWDLDDDGDGDPDASDCSPLDPSIYAGASESCDTVDQDCDGSLADEFDDRDADDDPDCTDPDDDGDGYNAEADGGEDCDDGDASVYPGAPESCDGIDSDCDTSLADEFADFEGDGIPDCIDSDNDNDGFQGGPDCNDLDATIFPGAEESCDAVDQDCDGSLVDEFADTDSDLDPDCTDPDDDGDLDPDDTDCADLDPAIHAGASESCDSIDTDCDGSLVDEYLDSDSDLIPDCIDDDDDGDLDPDDTDCAPLDATIHAGATEFCDSVDQDCDGSLVDEFDDTDADGEPDCTDSDDDGDGDPDLSDCAPLDATIHAGATESCDSVDQDCDGSLVDEFDDTDGDLEPDCTDLDDDGDGDPDETDCADQDATLAHGLPEICDGANADNDCDPATGDLLDVDGDGWTICDGDCDDSSAERRPQLPELCDGLDNDCDPESGEDETDSDGDGWRICDLDCDDERDDVHPFAPELCDEIDNDCDGVIESPESTDFLDWYADEDGDGFGDPDAPWAGNPDCSQPTGFVDDSTDCGPDSAEVHPGAVEVCDGLDDDCDPATDIDGTEVDGDGDGVLACENQGASGAAARADCDDGDPEVYPGAEELCGDGIDQDCDGTEGGGAAEDRDDPECWAPGCLRSEASVAAGGDRGRTADASRALFALLAAAALGWRSRRRVP
jgi:hypothetical protein